MSGGTPDRKARCRRDALVSRPAWPASPAASAGHAPSRHTGAPLPPLTGPRRHAARPESTAHLPHQSIRMTNQYVCLNTGMVECRAGRPGNHPRCRSYTLVIQPSPPANRKTGSPDTAIFHGDHFPRPGFIDLDATSGVRFLAESATFKMLTFPLRPTPPPACRRRPAARGKSPHARRTDKRRRTRPSHRCRRPRQTTRSP